jgi:hypothetical protein
MAGRIEGRRNGNAYEIVQGEMVIRTMTLQEALADAKLAAAIQRNKWQPILSEGEVIA